MIQIIILNYNAAQECLELWEQLQGFSSFENSVVIIDNNSELEDQQILKLNLPNEVLIFNKENLGYAEGNRIGIELAIKNKKPYVLLLNPDIRLSPTAIDQMLGIVEKDHSIAAIGPRICYRNNPGLIYSDGGIIDFHNGYKTSHLNFNQEIEEIDYLEMIHEVDYVNGSVFLARTEIFKKIGFMRKDFFLYFEETEWCLRAKKNNYKLLINSNALAYHTESFKGKNYHYYMTRNRIFLARIEKNFDIKTIKKIGFPIFKAVSDSFHKKKFPSLEVRAKAKGFIAGICKKLKE